jgi:hypothetical protein
MELDRRGWWGSVLGVVGGLRRRWLDRSTIELDGTTIIEQHYVIEGGKSSRRGWWGAKNSARGLKEAEPWSYSSSLHLSCTVVKPALRTSPCGETYTGLWVIPWKTSAQRHGYEWTRDPRPDKGSLDAPTAPHTRCTRWLWTGESTVPFGGHNARGNALLRPAHQRTG